MAETNKPVFDFTTGKIDGGFRQTSSLLGDAGGLEVKSDISPDKKIGSSQVEDNSYVLLQGKCKELFQLNGGNVTIKGNDVYIGSSQNMFMSIAGDTQTVIQGDQFTYTKGDQSETVGSASQEQIKAAKDAQKILNDIDKKKIDTIEKTKGEMVPCPTCSMEVLTDRGQCLIDLAWKLIRLAIPNFPYPLDILQKILNFLAIPFLTPEEVKALNQGKGCGSPGCKNGQVESPQKAVQTANEEAAKELKSKQKELGELQKKMGSGGTKLFGPFTGDVALLVGQPETMNQSPTIALKEAGTIPFGFKNTEQGFIPSTKGNCKKAIYSPPLMNLGSLSLTIAEKLILKTGAGGMDMRSNGLVDLQGSMTNIIATKGELNLFSNNVTTLKGKNIIIDADDKSGDSGISLDAQNTNVTGALTVNGDLGVKGAIMMDGGLYCTHITCPGERVATGPSGSSHQVQSGATWNNPIAGLQATLYDQYDKTYKKLSRDIFNVLSLNIANGMAEIKTLIEETYATGMIATTVDNMGMPTGYGQTYSAIPGSPTGMPLLVNGIAQAGPYPVSFIYTYVIPGQILPIFNFTHNHGSPGGNHSHDYTSFQGQPVGSNQAARGIRPDPSHVPTPPKANGIGTKPGHKNTGDLCIPCIWPFGGGGPNAKKRNSTWGLDPNAYNNVYKDNYVPVTGLKFDPNGNLIPPPFLDLGC